MTLAKPQVGGTGHLEDHQQIAEIVNGTARTVRRMMIQIVLLWLALIIQAVAGILLVLGTSH